jgi:hypothetical protein
MNIVYHVLVNYSTTLYKLIQLFNSQTDCSDCLQGNLKLPLCDGKEYREWSNPTTWVCVHYSCHSKPFIDVYRHWRPTNIG